jgi:hypothetical protein
MQGNSNGCRINDAKDKAQETTLNSLIDSLSTKRLNIPENHLRKIKDDLKRIQLYGNIGSHDNDETISSDEINRIDVTLESLLKNVFDSKEQIYIDQKLPPEIYHKITKSVIPLRQNSCRLKFLEKIKFEISDEKIYKVF